MDTLRAILRKHHLSANTPSPIEIPNFGRGNLARLFAQLGMTKGAEVGTWTGQFTTRLCKANSDLKLIGVDVDSSTPKRGMPDNCKVVRMDSLAAANKVVDNSLDFVYIDDHGDLANSVASIAAWSKKVRPGGIIAGFNYFRYRPQNLVKTQQAVDAFVTAYNIGTWFTTDRNVDRIRSWFWVKA